MKKKLKSPACPAGGAHVWVPKVVERVYISRGKGDQERCITILVTKEVVCPDCGTRRKV
jgi:hypothetical protein